MRMYMRRFTRLDNAFSKNFNRHFQAPLLHFVFYNFCRTYETLRLSPSMAAGITDRLWLLEDVLTRIDVGAPAPAKRRTYKKREA